MQNTYGYKFKALVRYLDRKANVMVETWIFVPGATLEQATAEVKSCFTTLKVEAV